MRIALFLPNWVGDVVMATPAVRAVRRQFADARLVAVGKPYVAGVLGGAPWFDAFVPVDRFWPCVSALRRERIDLAVLFPNSFRSALVAKLGGCRRVVGYASYGRSALLSTRLAPARDARGRIKPSPIIHAYNSLARAAGCPADSMRMELFTTPADEAQADEVWAKTGLDRFREVVALNPGAAFGASKLWPAESFATVARELVDRCGCGVLVLCGPAERDLARHIVTLSRRPDVYSLADFPVSLGLTKACVRRCDLLVSTDSGPRHFAAAFDRPVLALFGPTHIAWTDTFFAKEIRLQKAVPCGPCQQRVCPEGHHRCMKELTPAEVYAAAVALLTRYPARREDRRAC